MVLGANLEADDTQLNPGDTIDGKYEIICKIGQGRMGVVYRARSLSRKRDAAIKMLTHATPETLERFLRVAASMERIKHRAVVPIDDFGKTDKGGHYLAMTYVPGADLATFASTHKMSVQQAVDLTLAVCSGVSACHLQSIVHCDLKPSNVRVTQNGEWQDRIKILDVGLAVPVGSVVPADRDIEGVELAAMSDALRYLAPELLRDEHASKRCDQYAIASLLYLLLAGRAPFHGLQGAELTGAILDGAYPAVHIAQPGSPAVVRNAVTRALSLNPKHRFPSVDDFALAILPEASPALQHAWARQFTRAKLAMAPRPSEASAQPADHHVPGRGGAIAKITVPMALAPPDAVAAPAAPATPWRGHDGDGEAGLRQAQPERGKVCKPSGFIDLHSLLVFSWGAALGAALATAAFIALLSYQRHEAASWQSSLQAPSQSPQQADNTIRSTAHHAP